nr:hypothetical protein [Tanacetum cinerariifolium]
MYPCEFCEDDAYYGYYCTPQALFIYPEPCYNQDFNFLQDFQSIPQQYPCCDDCELSVCYDDDDEEERSDSLDDNIISGLPPFSAITPDEPILSTKEPDNSLSMGDEHLDTILATKSDEFIKSGVETLIPIPSESEGIPEHVCDVPFHDNSPPLDISDDQFEDFSESNEEFSSTDDDSFSLDKIDYVEASPPDSELVSSKVMEIVIPEETNNFDNSLLEFTTFSNVLYDAEYESDSSDDQSCSDEDILEKIVLKPLCEEEIIPMESLRTHDSFLPILSKIDSLLDEFAGELTLLKSILPGIDETDCDFKEDIHVIEKLLYDNSSPCPPEVFVSANSDAKIKSFSPSPILVKDSDSLMEEIDLFCTSDFPMPSGIEDKDYDSERDILILLDLPSNNTLSFAEKESFHFDIPLFSRPPAKPPDGDTGILKIKMMGNVSDQKAFMHKLMITLAPHQEKSPYLLSHRCGTVKKFNTYHSHLNECPMLIHRQNNPLLDVLLFHFIPFDLLKLKKTQKRQNRIETEQKQEAEKIAKGSKKAQEGNSKRAAGEKLEQEDAKRQRIKEENETAELRRCLEIIHEDDDDNMVYYLLVEKMHPFTRNFLLQMWNDVRLQVDYEVEMAYDLLGLIKRQINEGYILE